MLNLVRVIHLCSDVNAPDHLAAIDAVPFIDSAVFKKFVEYFSKLLETCCSIQRHTNQLVFRQTSLVLPKNFPCFFTSQAEVLSG